MPNVSKSLPIVKFVLYTLAMISLLIGLANLQFGTKLEEVKREGIDLMICLDVSNSMLAEDLSPNRLERSKRAIYQLIEKLHNDRLGIIVFAGQAYVQLPITTDYSSAKLFLETIGTDIVPTQGTSIGAAIDLAMESFDFENGTSKSIIVITDGENHEDDAKNSAIEAADKDVTVHTIGMGSEKGGPIP
ncbi:MAG: VWA domain-containing protein, partial [Flavobacteriales bacterium]|nr:VWA domain-containing protein [Flavobacteriales bacterium]